MAIRKISGNILQDNLERGSNLAIQGNLVYFDIANDRVGIRTENPDAVFTVEGNARVSNIQFDTNRIRGISGQIDLGLPANIIISGGSTDYVLKTDGNGNLEWTDPNNIGNLVINDTTIGTVDAGSDIVLEPTLSGFVKINTATGLVLASGTTLERPLLPLEGTIRFNTTTNLVEVYDGSNWTTVGGDLASITTQTISGDDSTQTFTLDKETTAASIIVSTNGIVQQPGIAYTVSGNSITFVEPPQIGDIVDVRFISSTLILNEISNSYGNVIQVTETGVANMATVHSLQLPSYTVAEANALSNVSPGQLIYCINGDSGSPCLSVYSNNAWKIVSLGANIAP